MTTRQTKQAIYGAIYLVVFVGIVTGGYFTFVRQAPSCFDGIQNGGETGVDCGGPCAKVCNPLNLQDIVVGGVRVFVSSPGHYTVLAEVENHNTGFAMRSFNYQFDLYNASGTLIDSVPGQSFLYASEVKYLLLPNWGSLSWVDHAELTIQNPDWETGSAMGLVPQFGNPLPIVSSAVSSNMVIVNGQITDRDVAAFNNILIIAIFYSKNGNPVGASQTVLDSIAPNQTENFSVMYPAVSNLNPALTKAFAYALRQ